MKLEAMKWLPLPLRAAQSSLVVDASQTSVPLIAGESRPVSLEGETSFTPAQGKAYELLVELRGRVAVDSSQNLSPPVVCPARVGISAGGEEISSVRVEPDIPTDRLVMPIGLLEPGKPIVFTATSSLSGFAAEGQASIRVVVVEFG